MLLFTYLCTQAKLVCWGKSLLEKMHKLKESNSMSLFTNCCLLTGIDDWISARIKVQLHYSQAAGGRF